MIREILERHLSVRWANRRSLVDALEADLMAREDEIADNLRMAGAQLGAMPQFVAKVLMDVGLGTPPTPEAREMINRQFAVALAEIQRILRERGDN